jgi:putative oxidoreductase
MGGGTAQSKEVDMDAVDAGLLVLRAFLGLLMVAHGSQKLLGWFNGYGVRGTGGYFASIGYPAGTLMAVLAGSVEAGGGVALAAGFLTPLVSLAFVALFVNVAWAGHGHSFWNHNQPFGVEYPLVLGVLSAVFALTGPGAYSLDAALGWTTFFGPGWFAAAILGGFAAGVLVLWLRRRPAAVVAESDASAASTDEPVA